MKKLSSYTDDYVSDNEYIHINKCGILPCKDKSANVLRPNGRKDYLLLYVLKGTCVLNQNSGKPHIIEKGHVILFKPNEPQYYLFPKENDSVQIYVHFTGFGCEELFNRAEIKESIIKPQHPNELEYYLQKICELFDADDNRKVLQSAGLLITCFGLIATEKIVGKDYSVPKSHKQISFIIGKFQTEPQLSYSIEELAEQCNVSTPQFISIFKNATGYSPYQYLTKTRISYAKELLLFTDLGIAEISNLTGYGDQNYFARIFKKSTGLSPSKFRSRESQME